MKFTKSERFAFIGTLFFGIIAHGYMLANNFQYHDDAGFYGVGAGLALGRGSNLLISVILKVFFGGEIISVPLFNGFLAILILSCVSLMIVRIIKLNNIFLALMTGGIIAVFPSLTSVLGYKFMVYTYALGYLCAAFGVYLIVSEQQSLSFKRLFASITLFVFSVGIYQSIIPFILTLASLTIFIKFIDNDYSWKIFCYEIFKWACICAVFMTIYAILTILPLWIYPMFGKKFAFTSYQSFNETSVFSLSEIVNRVITAYLKAFYPPIGTKGDLYPMSIRYFFYIVMVVSVVLTLLIIKRTYSRSKRQGLQIAIISSVMPLMINFVYVMCDAEKTSIYSIMEYSQAFVFIYMCFIFELAVKNNFINSECVSKYFYRTVSTLMIIVCFLYIRYDNICYLKAYYIQTRAISYFNVLQARIQSVPGYKDNYPVVWVNRYDKSRLNVTKTEQLKNINIPPYYDDLLDDYTWVEFMSLHCGYSPEVYYCGKDYVFDNPERVITPSAEVMEQVKAMPHYPEYDSIRVIDGKVFVNF